MQHKCSLEINFKRYEGGITMREACSCFYMLVTFPNAYVLASSFMMLKVRAEKL